MHEKEVGRVLFLTNLGSNTCCHRNCGYACSTDERVDLTLGQEVHDVTDDKSADSSKSECSETETDDKQCLELQEVSADSRSTYGCSEEYGYDVAESILCCVRQTLRNAGYSEEVTEHEAVCSILT